MPRSVLVGTIVGVALIWALRFLLQRRQPSDASASGASARLGRIMALEPVVIAVGLAIVAVIAWVMSK